MKIFPIPVLEILPVAVMAAVLSGCHSTTVVEASSTRDPVVAPAGTVLRVRLDQTLETGQSRPGDRFSGVLDSALLSGSVEILRKGTIVEGRIVTSTQAGRAVLAVKLESYGTGGTRRPIATNTLSRVAGSTKTAEVTRSTEAANLANRPNNRAKSSAHTALPGVLGRTAGLDVSPRSAVGVTMAADSIIGFTLTGILGI